MRQPAFSRRGQDYIEGVLDLAAILDLRRSGRYPARVKGHALAARGIQDGDILVADAAAEPKAGKVCVAMVGGEVILATLTRREDRWVLAPSSGALVTIADDVEVWAIVEGLVRTRVWDGRTHRRQQLLLLLRAGLRPNAARQTHCRAVEQ
jgi:DNA polymerase V